MEMEVLKNIVEGGVVTILAFYILYNYVIESKDFKKQSEIREKSHLKIIGDFSITLERFNASLTNINSEMKDLGEEVKEIKFKLDN